MRAPADLPGERAVGLIRGKPGRSDNGHARCDEVQRSEAARRAETYRRDAGGNLTQSKDGLGKVA